MSFSDGELWLILTLLIWTFVAVSILFSLFFAFISIPFFIIAYIIAIAFHRKRSGGRRLILKVMGIYFILVGLILSIWSASAYFAEESILQQYGFSRLAADSAERALYLTTFGLVIAGTGSALAILGFRNRCSSSAIAPTK